MAYWSDYGWVIATSLSFLELFFLTHLLPQYP